MEEQNDLTICGSPGESLRHAVKLPSQYKIIEMLGLGGMGAVYKAHDEAVGRDVVIKVLNFEGFRSPEAQKRFLKEAKLLALSQHPNIVQIYSSGLTEDGDVFEVMEFIEGKPLTSRLALDSGLTAAEFGQIFGQVSSGLAYLHERGIVHRDIKPGNIMLSGVDPSNLKVRIIDLGIARTLDAGDSIALTRTNAVLGSPAYMSPEQCAGKKAEPSSDIYSLGCIMYECVAGKPPFTGESALAVMQKHMYEPVPVLKVGKTSSGLTKLSKLIEQCLEKDPARRPSSAVDLLNRIEDVCAGSEFTLGVHCSNLNESGSLRWFWLLGSAVLLPGVVALVCFLSGKGQIPGFESKQNSGAIADGGGVRRVKASTMGELKRIGKEVQRLGKIEDQSSVHNLPEYGDLKKKLDGIIADKSATDVNRFVALKLKSNLLQICGEHRAVLDTELQALKFCQVNGKPSIEAAHVYANMSLMYFFLNDRKSAKTAAEKVLQLKTEFADGSNERLLDPEVSKDLTHMYGEKDRAHAVLAGIAAEEANLPEAEKHLELVKQSYLLAHLWHTAAQSVKGVADILHEGKHDSDALRIVRRFAGELLAIKEPAGKEFAFAESLLITASWLQDRDPDLAERCCQKGLEAAQKYTNIPARVSVDLKSLMDSLKKTKK